MFKTKVSGYSDDIIEIINIISPPDDEIICYNNQNATLYFDDGTIINVYYAENGVWKINIVIEGTAVFKKLVECSDDNYTDTFYISAEVINYIIK